jgi:hypothetical protein
MFTGEEFSPSAVTDRPLQDNKNLDNFGLPESHSSNSKPSTSGLKEDHASSESNLRHISPVEIRPFPKAEVLRENRKEKTRVSAVLIDTPIKTALEAEVEARAKPVKCNRLFSDSQERSRKHKQLKEHVRRVDSPEKEENALVLNV